MEYYSDHLSDYVRGQLSVSFADHKLTLGNSASLFDGSYPSVGRGNVMYNRDCYTDLLAIIDECHGHNEPVIVTGSSGVGKTSMRNLCFQAALSKPFAGSTKRSIVMHKAGTSECYVVTLVLLAAPPAVLVPITVESFAPVVQNGLNGAPDIIPVESHIQVETRYVRVLREIEFLSDLGSAYYLVDSSSTDRPSIFCFEVSLHNVIVFSSPSTQGPRNLKDKKPVTLHMPLWTLQELLDANAALNLNITEDVIRTRYKQLGGQARYVLDTVSRNYTRRLAHLKNSIGSAEINAAGQPTGFTSKLASHCFVYSFVKQDVVATGKYNYEEAHSGWGTKYLIDMFVSHSTAGIRNKVNSVTSAHRTDATPGQGQTGHAFQTYALKALATGGFNGTCTTSCVAMKRPRNHTYETTVDFATRKSLF